jgi:hypothetical protein
MSENDAGRELTLWACGHCQYEAVEYNEREARPCQYCQAGEESRLTDPKQVYWWCYKCHRTTTIEQTS